MLDDKEDRIYRHFDWVVQNNLSEPDYKKLQMLRCLRDMCKDCIMCLLGRQKHTHNNKSIENQHVFSNMKLSKIFIVGQNPGVEECEKDEPFVGASGRNFDMELTKYDLSRNDLYISNICKCHSPENRAPLPQEITSCEIYIRAEIAILKPYLVVTLGSSAFGAFCPQLQLSDSLGQIHHSEKYGVKVYPIYHPSPRNMNVIERKDRFQKDMRMLCKLVQKIRKNSSE